MQYVFRSLHIKIFSPDLQLETLLKALTLPTEFCFQIETCTDFTEGEPCCEDIVLLVSPVTLHSRILGL